MTDAGSEPADYTWTLSTAVKWNAGMANFHGVNTSTVWDTAATSATSTSTTGLVLPGVTTTTAGAMLVGGVALNSSSINPTPQSGWTETLEATGVQVTEMAHQLRSGAGATGNQTWTMSTAAAVTGWMRALRPA